MVVGNFIDFLCSGVGVFGVAVGGWINGIGVSGAGRRGLWIVSVLMAPRVLVGGFGGTRIGQPEFFLYDTVGNAQGSRITALNRVVLRFRSLLAARHGVKMV